MKWAFVAIDMLAFIVAYHVAKWCLGAAFDPLYHVGLYVIMYASVTRYDKADE